MHRRDFNIGAILALLSTGAASMSPENERRAVAALQSIAKSLAEMARSSGRSALSGSERNAECTACCGLGYGSGDCTLTRHHDGPCMVDGKEAW